MTYLKYTVPLIIGLVFSYSSGAGQKEKGTDEFVPLKTKEFLGKVLEMNHSVIEMAQVAKVHASREEVKELAKMLVDDHMKSREKLLDLAKNEKIAVAIGESKILALARKTLTELKGEKGFDQTYLKNVVDRHEEAIEFLEVQKKSPDTEVREFAEKVLPTLRKHLKRANSLITQ